MEFEELQYLAHNLLDNKEGPAYERQQMFMESLRGFVFLFCVSNGSPVQCTLFLVDRVGYNEDSHSKDESVLSLQVAHLTPSVCELCSHF